MKGLAIKLRPWNLLDHLVTQEDVIAYVSTCLAEGDAALIVHALHALVQKKDGGAVAGRAAVASDRNAQAPTEFDLVWVLCTLRTLGLELRVIAATSS